jgi:hypothetical protein
VALSPTPIAPATAQAPADAAMQTPNPTMPATGAARFATLTAFFATRFTVLVTDFAAQLKQISPSRSNALIVSPQT